MSESEFPAGVRKRAVWCHLSGIVWAMVQVAWNVLSVPFMFAVGPAGPSGELASYVLVGLVGITSLLSFPFLSGFVTALIFWKVNREFHPFVDDTGKAATNFQATMGLYSFCAFLVFCFLVLVTCGPVLYGGSWYGGGSNSESVLMALGIGVILLGGVLSLAWSIFQVVVASLAAAKAGKGQVYVYPLSRQFFS